MAIFRVSSIRQFIWTNLAWNAFCDGLSLSIPSLLIKLLFNKVFEILSLLCIDPAASLLCGFVHSSFSVWQSCIVRGGLLLNEMIINARVSSEHFWLSLPSFNVPSTFLHLRSALTRYAHSWKFFSSRCIEPQEPHLQFVILHDYQFCTLH